MNIPLPGGQAGSLLPLAVLFFIMLGIALGMFFFFRRRRWF